MERTIPLFSLEGVKDARISTHPFSTADNIGLSMLRFLQQESDDVVLIIHGLTTSSDMFIMPEHNNLVSYLHQNGYGDVWTLDFRMSMRHAYNLQKLRFNLDDCALYDMPAAIDEMRKHIGNRRLHVIGHCLGSATFSMSLFAKQVSGIRSFIGNSVTLTPRIRPWSRFKITVGPFLVEHLMMQPYANPRWAREPGTSPGKYFAKLVNLFHHECDNSDCHMLSFIWGTGWPALYEHKNLDPITHERVGDLFGGTALNYHRHVRKMVAKGVAVKYHPKDKRYAALPNNYLQFAAEIETPMLLVTGDNNKIFTDSNLHTFKALEAIVPGRHELATFPDYGHQDVFMGKDSDQDIFPRFLQFLRKHSK